MTYVFGAAPQRGDRVLVRRHQFSGRHKLEDRWEEKVYKIIGQDNAEIPVYRVKAEDGSGKEKVLHRNNIFPVIWTVESEGLQNQKIKIKSKSPSSTKLMKESDESSESDSDADMEIDFHLDVHLKLKYLI